ncbi:MAG: hypothetical protein AMJ69_08760 [Gammaproteobacteria bacterium SG8_47]|nr:MAG: hypothetical protein AMJ69_08760 [Gammaproteobacteria bacterium SG8_47]
MTAKPTDHLRTATLLVLVCASALAGCGSTTEQALETSALARRIMGEQHGSPGPVEALRIHYSLKEKPMIGRAVEVEFEYYPAQDASSLQLGYITSEGLELNPGDAATQLDAVKANRKLVHRVAITPREEGVFTLTVFAVLGQGENQIARSRAVTIAVGAVDLPSLGWD